MVIVSENMQQKTSKLILNHNAIRFKENIAAEITKNQIQANVKNETKVKTLGRTKVAGVQAGARYECIYKNLLRDIRQFYSTKYEVFIKKQNNQFQKIPMYKYLLFPYQVLEFTFETFEPLLLEISHGYSDKSRIDFMKHLAHRIGCFILPKYMMKAYCESNAQDEGQKLPEQIIDYFKHVRSKFSLND